MEQINTTDFKDLQTTAATYESPRIEILEIAVEKGFAGSPV
jgi:hypothetical protein